MKWREIDAYFEIPADPSNGLDFCDPTRMMLLQEKLIVKVRELCQQDEHLVAALMYGSFVTGDGDKFSDIEFVFYFLDDVVGQIDQAAWVSQIAPVELYFADDVGHHTAIFSNLIRAEFHFLPVSRMNEAETWQGNAWFPSLETAILLDRSGKLSDYLQPLTVVPKRDSPEQIQALCFNFINWFLFGLNVSTRGEKARALELLGICHRYLLWLVRVMEGETQHWPTPSRLLEQDISTSAYQRFKLCTSDLDPASLSRAYLNTWQWGLELIETLQNRYVFTVPGSLLKKIDRLLANDQYG